MAEKAIIQPKKPKPLSKQLKFWYGLGDFGFTLMVNVENYYFNFFLTNVAMFSIGATALITTIASTIDAAISWIYGAILNGIKPGKWGRYRSWLIMAPWIVPFLYAFQFMKIGNDTVSAVIIIVASIVSHVVWNFPYAANAAMIAVAGGDAQGKTVLSSSRATWNNLGNVAFSYLGMPLASILAGMVGQTNRFGAVAFVLAAVMAVGYYVHFRITNGYEETEDVTVPSKSQASIRDMLKALFENPNLILLLVADFSKFLVKFLTTGAAIYYFTYTANKPQLQATFILFTGILSVFGSYLARYIVKALTNRNTAILSYAIMSAVMLISYFTYSNVTLVVVLMLIAQFGYGVCYACMPALYADTAVYAEWKTGKNNAGWIMGLLNVPLKLSVIAKSVIIASCLAAAKFDGKINPAMATVELKKGITAAFALWPAIVMAAGTLILIFGFKLTQNKVEKYQAEIDARG